MAVSALDLLIALNARLDELETTSITPGSALRMRQEWGALARASLQLLQAGPRQPNNSTRRLEILLNSLAAIPGEYPLPDPGTGLMAITTVIGCTAQIMRTPTITNPETREQASRAIRTNLEAALARAARWAQHGIGAIAATPDPQLVRLAGIHTQPYLSPALHAWRNIGPTDPNIDGAVSRWEAAATQAITSPHTVTQLALQLASADIALLCASTKAVMERVIHSGAIPDTPAAVAALETAGRSWRQTARWPNHLRLGGRTTELRHASADLRQSLDNSLRTGNDWKQPSELFADHSPEHHLAVLHTSLQSATRVGNNIVNALAEITYGTNRVWLNVRQNPTPMGSGKRMLRNPNHTWRPDPGGFHSARTLHHQASQALTGLTHATPLTIKTLVSRTPPTERVGGDQGPWETVSPSLDPLQVAQERVRLAATTPTEPAAHATIR